MTFATFPTMSPFVRTMPRISRLREAARRICPGGAPLAAWGLLLLGSLAAWTPLRAAVIERDLGEGLLYFRIHRVPEDLPTNDSVRRHPCVVDLRYAHGNSEAATVLGGWIKFHATTHTPLFVLVNASTSAELLPALAHRDHTAGLLVIGTAAQRFEPDIVVHESSADERRAYEALEKGAAIAALTTDNPDKQRNDEASLARDRSPEPSSDDDTDITDPDEPAPAKPKGPTIDAALQEAIHLHDGLRAMKPL